MSKSNIFIQSKSNKSGDAFEIELMVSASGLPRVPFHLPVVVGENDDPVFLPNFGIEKSDEKSGFQPTPENPGLQPPSETSDPPEDFTDDISSIDAEAIVEPSLSGKHPKVDLDEKGAYDEFSNSEENDESDMTIGRLLYIIPIAIICVLIIIFIGVIFLMRSNRKRRNDSDQKSHLTKYTPATQVANVKTEEGDKSTTYVIAAAQDSTVKGRVKNYAPIVPNIGHQMV